MYIMHAWTILQLRAFMVTPDGIILAELPSASRWHLNESQS